MYNWIPSLAVVRLHMPELTQGPCLILSLVQRAVSSRGTGKVRLDSEKSVRTARQIQVDSASAALSKQMRQRLANLLGLQGAG